MRSAKKVVTRCAAAWVVWMMATPAMPQEPAPQEPAPQGPVIKTEVNLVNLFATVRDKKKHIMTGLKKEDFRIF